ncbi:MAG: hypothetical protein IJS14_08905 [Lentisphaeria bacterium]|nr:hypothetical protein [Lentisphaeria bacterium]
MTGGMKKLLLCQIAGVIILFGIVFFRTQTLMLILAPFGLVPVYTDQGTVSIQAGNKSITSGIYTRKGAPYVLIAPCPFHEQNDFFFIRKNEVVGRCLDDKIEGDFFRLFKWLLICFDLSDGHLDSWAPSFNFKSTIRYDETRAINRYQVILNDDRPEQPQVEVSFSVDKRFLQ